MKLLDDFVKLLQIERYSYSTISSYSSALMKFAESFPSRRLEELQKADIEFYINRQVVQNKISQSYQKQLVGALKIYYNDLLRKNFDFSYLYPDRSEKKIPVVLSKEEVRSLIDKTQICNKRQIIS